MLKSPKAQPTLNSHMMGVTVGYINLSVEELIGHAHRGATQPEADITLSNGETLSQQDKIDFYAAISKEIVSTVRQLRSHQVQIVAQPGDAPFMILARTVNELQRRARCLLSNPRVYEELKTQYRVIETPETQEAHTTQQLIQMSAVLNKIDEYLFTKGHPYSPRNLDPIALDLSLDQRYLDIMTYDLTHIGITHITPRMITTLTKYPKLQSVGFAYNELTILPEAIWQLRQLRTLILSNNKLTTLPASMSQFNSDTYFLLDDNPFTSLPECLRGTLERIGDMKRYGHLLTPTARVAELAASSSSSSNSSSASSIRSYTPNFAPSSSPSSSSSRSFSPASEQSNPPIAGKTCSTSKAESTRPTKKQKRR